jgi:hypothetical protein
VPGLALESIQGVAVAPLDFRQALAMLRGAGRPLTLGFRESEPEPAGARGRAAPSALAPAQADAVVAAQLEATAQAATAAEIEALKAQLAAQQEEAVVAAIAAETAAAAAAAAVEQVEEQGYVDELQALRRERDGLITERDALAAGRVEAEEGRRHAEAAAVEAALHHQVAPAARPPRHTYIRDSRPG